MSSPLSKDLLHYLNRVLAMTKTGLSYSDNPYDLERYEELRDRTAEMIERLTGVSQVEVLSYVQHMDKYPTPKVDVRGVVLRAGKILLIREKSDGKWAMPGGWADVGHSPAENMVKEVREESGLAVVAERLLAVWDKRLHDHPPFLEEVYKLCFLCREVGGALGGGFEVTDAGFFGLDELPPLSLDRNTEAQIRQLVTLATAGGLSVD